MKKAFWILIALVLLLAITAVSVTIITAKQPPEWQYTRMGAQVNYAIGQRVQNGGRTYECIQWDEGSPLVMVPPEANPAWWAVLP